MSGRWTAWATAPRPATPTRRGRRGTRAGGDWAMRRSIRADPTRPRMPAPAVALTVARRSRRLAAMSDVSPPASSLARHGTEWWREGIVYQVYPRSYGDTDGNGIGDLPGIIEHLDYLGPTGSGSMRIWLSPIYPSPGLDVGYDVSDHAAVDPLLGTEDDFDRLVREAHARGIRVILDLVMNHTSDQHAWFQASARRARVRTPTTTCGAIRPVGTPMARRCRRTTGCRSSAGRRWQYEPARDQFYLHTFLVEQPEVNWRNPAVEAAQLAMVRGWLDRGVDGFRLDVFNIFLKDPDLPSNPELTDVPDGTSAWDRQVHKYDRDQPDFPALIASSGRSSTRCPDGCRSASCSTAVRRRRPA